MTAYPDNVDGAVLADLASQGVDMSLPLLIEFAVAVDSQEAAKSSCQAMSAAGYDCKIEYDEGEPDFDPDEDDPEEFGPCWTVYADVRMVPQYEEIMRIQTELEQLVQPFGGHSDGWGVMLDGEPEA